jgi:hypothetical protein
MLESLASIILIAASALPINDGGVGLDAAQRRLDIKPFLMAQDLHELKRYDSRLSLRLNEDEILINEVIYNVNAHKRVALSLQIQVIDYIASEVDLHQILARFQE